MPNTTDETSRKSGHRGSNSEAHQVVVLGNPNTGKSTLFNALTGVRQHTGNFPGVTVEKRNGRMEIDQNVFVLTDLPGTYSLAPRSPDEMLTVNVLLGKQPAEHEPDLILCVVDASNLERNLFLVSQVLDQALSVRALEAIVRVDDDQPPPPAQPDDAPPSASDAVGATKPPALLELEELLGDRFDTKVAISLGNRRGKLTIDFADIDDLERIYALMTSSDD